MGHDDALRARPTAEFVFDERPKARLEHHLWQDCVAGLLEAEAELAAASCRQAGAREVRVAESEEERTNLWKGRKKAFGAMGRIAPDLLVQDATVPRTQLPTVLARIDAPSAPKAQPAP